MKKTTRDRAPPLDLTKLITEISHRHGQWQVFSDFVEMAAISISNAIDMQQREQREARYMEIVKRYTKEEIEHFPKMLAALVFELETEPHDVLGTVFHELELHNKFNGQFFTPYPICRMMAKMVIDDHSALRSKLVERNFITAQEPACGSGAMVIALAHELHALGINYQQQLHITAIDIDPKCVHMSYLQLSLLHIPAIVIHGNTISLEQFGRWYTPAHIIGGWGRKLREREGLEALMVPEKLEAQAQPSSESAPLLEVPTQLKLL
jgi:N-6 DNA Methylase